MFSRPSLVTAIIVLAAIALVIVLGIYAGQMRPDPYYPSYRPPGR